MDVIKRGRIKTFKRTLMKNYCRPFLLSIFLFSSLGCSLLLGNIKPVEEKAKNYQILDISKNNADWVRLDSKLIESSKNKTNRHSEAPESGGADITYQSSRSGSIISIDSACRSNSMKPQEVNLGQLTNQLLLGISNLRNKKEENLTIENETALQTTIEGEIEHQLMNLKTVVLKKNNCIYDFMYIARPENFKENEKDFSQFVYSFHIK